MVKADLIDEMVRAAAVSRKDSETIIEIVFDTIIDSLRAGDKVEIRGFGSFRTRQRDSRIGRNPKTGERVPVPARRVAYFRPSKELRDGINGLVAPVE